MAFPQAQGYGNLPGGNWSAEIFSMMAQIAFRKESVIRDITNSDYYGEIAEYGDTVRIIKEPNIEVSTYVRGQTVRAQDLDDDEIVLMIDQSNKFAFRVDDIEKKQAHHDWEALATNQAGYRMRDKYDSEVLNYMSTQVGNNDGGEIDLSSHKIGAAGAPVDIVTDGTENNSTSFSALSMLNRMKRLLDQQFVPGEGRWFVGDPVFYERLGDENSKVLNNDFVDKGILRNGMVSEGMLRGFKLYQSNNLPSAGSGPAGTTTSDHGVILAGHTSSTATAEQLNKVETYRDPDSFADVTRGLHLYGRKVLRPEALVGAWYHSAA